MKTVLVFVVGFVAGIAAAWGIAGREAAAPVTTAVVPSASPYAPVAYVSPAAPLAAPPSTGIADAAEDSAEDAHCFLLRWSSIFGGTPRSALWDRAHGFRGGVLLRAPMKKPRVAGLLDPRLRGDE